MMLQALINEVCLLTLIASSLSFDSLFSSIYSNKAIIGLRLNQASVSSRIDLLETNVQLAPVRQSKEDFAYLFRYIVGLYLVISFLPLSQKFLVINQFL